VNRDAVRGVRASLAVALALLAIPAEAEDARFNGIAIGTSVAALAAGAGFPTAVASEDSGNRFVYPDGTTAYADDDGRILAVAIGAGTARVAIDGAPYSFAIGRYSAADAERELSSEAEYATPALRSYRLEPQRHLVLAFDPAQRLQRVTYGEPGQLARLGLLPGDAAAKAVTYHPPQPIRPGVAASGQGPLTAVYRIAVDRSGRVAGVAVVIPPSAKETVTAARARPGLPLDPAQLAEPVAVGLRQGTYAPALLDGKPIAATIFARVHFTAPTGSAASAR
jgi:hypothetical protein